MAEEEMVEAESPGGMGILGFVAATVAAVAASVVEFVAGDRAIMGAFRQGLDELGAALQPLPNSISQDEMGTLWSPTPGEIAAAGRQEDWWNHPSYAVSPGQAFCSYDGPSPGEIAASNEPYLPQQDQGHNLGDDMSY